jgi:hypothetical protein
LSHDNREVEPFDASWEETDYKESGSAYTLRKQNRARSQQSRASRRIERRDERQFDECQPRPAVKRLRPEHTQEFRCRHCRTFVGPVPSGGKHRNHCPVCLHSRHVDLSRPGDRLSPCGGTMAPIGVFSRSDGEYALVHRCLACGIERHNRIAADDDFELVLTLPNLTRWTPNRRQAAGQAEEETA